MTVLAKTFNGQVFVYDTDRRTLTVEIRKGYVAGSDYGHLGDRGFSINRAALDFALWNGLMINFLNEGMKYKIHPSKLMQIVRKREAAGAKAIFEEQGIPLLMIQAKDCDAQGYYAKGEETL